MKQTAPLFGIALFLFAARALFGAQATSSVADDPVIELPKFIVTDSRELPPPESWRYAAIPGFEILSNASERATQRLIRDFDMFRQALGHVWPLPQRNLLTTPLIICGRGAKFDRFIPAGKVNAETAFASLFLKQGNRTAIVIDFESTTLNVFNLEAASEPGTDGDRVLVEPNKQLYREYVRYLLSQNEPRSPAWLEEGLAQIVMKMQFDRRWIEFAKLEDPNTVSPQAAMIAEMNAQMASEDPEAPTFAGAPAEDRDFPAALRRRALIPLDKFFAVTHDSPEATNTLGNNRWGKQAYAFVHMCLYGYKGKYQKAFAAFLLRAAREPVTEAMFKECFRFPGRNGTFTEMSYKDMLMELRSYCDFTVYEAKLFKAKEDVIIPPPPLALREATQSEIGRLKGEAMLLAGHTKEARLELIAPYQRGERDPYLLASLGLYEQAHGEPARARKFLEAAMTGKARRPDAALELARLRYVDALAQPAGAGGRFSAGQAAGVLEPLLFVRRQPPHLLPLYELVADTWMRSETRPKRDDAIVLIDGAQLFPTRLKLVYQAAVVAAEAGEVQAAHALADHGVRLGPDANVKKRFSDLKASLPPAPPAAPAAPSPAPAPAGKKSSS